MRKEGLIKAFIPVEKITELVSVSDVFYETKITYKQRVAGDPDAAKGNDGIIFVFVS